MLSDTGTSVIVSSTVTLREIVPLVFVVENVTWLHLPAVRVMSYE